MDAERQKTDKLHNGGYSLIELVIVLAIIAIIMSTVFYAIILIFSANAKSTANDIQRAIGDCKVTTMGRSAAYMKLYRNADGDVFTQMVVKDSSGAEVASEPQKVGPKRVTVAYKPESGIRTELPEGESNGIEIRFDRASGGFDQNSNFYEVIYVEGGSKKFEIVLTKLTGKSEVKAVP